MTKHTMYEFGGKKVLLGVSNSRLTFLLNSVLNVISCKMKWNCGAVKSSFHFTYLYPTHSVPQWQPGNVMFPGPQHTLRGHSLHSVRSNASLAMEHKIKEIPNSKQWKISGWLVIVKTEWRQLAKIKMWNVESLLVCDLNTQTDLHTRWRTFKATVKAAHTIYSRSAHAWKITHHPQLPK